MKLFLFIIIIFSACFNAYSQKSNYDIVDSLSNEYSNIIIEKINSFSSDTVGFKINGSKIYWTTEKKIKSGVFKKLSFLKEYPSVSVIVDSIDINYNYIDDENIIRNIKYSASHSFTDSLGNITSFSSKSYIYNDTLDYIKAKQLTIGFVNMGEDNLPIPKQSFLKKYIEPIAVFAVAAVTVILFFTVRSK